MKKNKYDERQQEIRSLQRRQDEISHAQRNNCWVELEEPEKHGWYIRMVMRPDVARRGDVDSIQEVIDIVEREIWVKNKVTGRRARGHYCQHTKKANWEEYFPWKDHNGYPANYGVPFWYYKEHLSADAKKWFDKPLFIDYWGRGWCSCNAPDWFWERKLERCWATHYQEIDTELEKEDVWIDNTLDSKKYYKATRKDQWRNYPQGGRNIYTREVRAQNKQALIKIAQFDYDDTVAYFRKGEECTWDWY